MWFDKVLVCSTGHVPKHTAERLSADGNEMPAMMRWEYGWLVWCDTGIDAWEETHPELVAVMKYAEKLGCQWVRFDSDADKLEGFPFFDW